jgi:dTDP-4-dehydrorhamnose reductase
MTRVLITGAGGLVGSALAAAYGDDAVALRHRELDITDARTVDATVARIRPEVVFNCAVIGVDDCEADPALAERVNVTGPVQLAAAAERTGAAIVHFSSNYVFDGRRTDGLPYTIEDEAHPVNVYGTTKLQGERAVAATCPRALIVRTSWVFGRGKASFLSTAAEKLARGERLQAISDTFASTTYVADLVERLGELVRLRHYGTFHLVNDGACSYETFAREAARILGLGDPLIDSIPERRPAPRPRWTPMRCLLSERLGLRPLRPWQDALRDYVQPPTSS